MPKCLEPLSGSQSPLIDFSGHVELPSFFPDEVMGTCCCVPCLCGRRAVVECSPCSHGIPGKKDPLPFRSATRHGPLLSHDWQQEQ